MMDWLHNSGEFSEATEIAFLKHLEDVRKWKGLAKKWIK